VHDTVGRCDREGKCGYHKPPRQYFMENDIDPNAVQIKQSTPKERPIESPSYIHPAIFQKSLACYEQNHFVQFLIRKFGPTPAEEAVERYYIGTSKKWPGATVFWQVDVDHRIRTGKIMLYDPHTGNRVKDRYNKVSWVHSLYEGGNQDFVLSQCFFGEHLLTQDLEKKVAVVESEKTAVIASLLLPDFIWLACGGRDGLSAAKAGVLKGRSVVLCPDAGCFDHWCKRRKELSHIGHFFVSGVLETNISEEEKQEGYDIADYLIRQEELCSCSCSS
jgi:hypothetical protein